MMIIGDIDMNNEKAVMGVGGAVVLTGISVYLLGRRKKQAESVDVLWKDLLYGMNPKCIVDYDYYHATLKSTDVLLKNARTIDLVNANGDLIASFPASKYKPGSTVVRTYTPTAPGGHDMIIPPGQYVLLGDKYFGVSSDGVWLFWDNKKYNLIRKEVV